MAQSAPLQSAPLQPVQAQSASSPSAPVRRKRQGPFQLVFMATGAFAVPAMQTLCESNLYDIVCLVTAPLRYDKQGKPIITPARQLAEKYNVPISDHENINSPEFCEFLYLVRPDLVFVCDFGQILSQRTLLGPYIGTINLHGSLLPKFRGAAPVHWAILTGETFTGVSIIHMTPQIDAGPVIAQSPPIPIGPTETVIELEERLAEYGAELVLDTVARFANDEQVKIIPQPVDQVTKAPKLKKEHGFVPWELSANEVYNHFRATVPWPRAFTNWYRENGDPNRLIFGKITPLDDSFSEIVHDEDCVSPLFVAPVLTDAKMHNLTEFKAVSKEKKKTERGKKTSQKAHRPSWWQPGTVVRAEGDELIIAAQEGTVRIDLIKPAGKKMMLASEFLRGYPVKQGDKLGK